MTRAVDSRALIATDGTDVRIKAGGVFPPAADRSLVDANGNRTGASEGMFALPGWQVWGLATVGGTRVLVAYEMQADGTWAGPFGAPAATGGGTGTGPARSMLSTWVNGAHAVDDLVVDPVALGVYRCTAAHTDAPDQARPDLARFTLVGDWAGRRPTVSDPRVAYAQQPIGVPGAVWGTVYGRVQGAGLITDVALRVGNSFGTIAIAYHPDSGPSVPATAPAAPTVTSGTVPCPDAGDASVSINGGAPVAVYHNDWLSLWVDNAAATFQCTGSSPFDSDLCLGWSGYDVSPTAQQIGRTPTVVSGSTSGIVLIGKS